MVRIAEKAEESINYIKRFNSRDNSDVAFDVTNAISHATCTTAHDLGAKAIITVTKSGVTARQLSKFRPLYPIVGCTTQEHVWRQLNLSWGVVPALVDEVGDTDTLFERAVDAAEKTGLVESGDLVVITAGVPLGISGTTNMMKVHVVGHVLLTGDGRHRADGFRPAVRVQAAVGHPQALPGRGHFGGARDGQHHCGLPAALFRHHHRGGRHQLPRRHRGPGHG